MGPAPPPADHATPAVPDPLPSFVPPMLCASAAPFDSDEHVFEIKWDGTRALLFRDATGPTHRLRNRRDRDCAPRYPELDVLAALPPGLVLDGEIAVLVDGRADFAAMLSREQAATRARADTLARTLPATYVVFDLLHEDHVPRLDEPLADRRARLAEVVARAVETTPELLPRLVFSDGLVGEGRAYHEQVTALGIEGVVAKRLDSRYRPGVRSDAWCKIKAQHRLHVAIIGYITDEQGDLASLVIAADLEDGEGLRCVGRVGSGLTAVARADLLPLLASRPRAQPVVATETTAHWVEPDLFAIVSFLEVTDGGNLRAPVFRQLVTG